MPCILRAYGETLDAEALTTCIQLEAKRVWKRGEKRSATSGKVHSDSGVTFAASNADLDDFMSQVSDAIAFLERNLASVSALSAFPGVERVTLDFGRAIYKSNFAAFSYLPPQLVRLAASANIGIEISVYTSSDEPDSES